VCSAQRLGDSVSFNELVDRHHYRHRVSVEILDGVLETVGYVVRKSSRIEPFETVPLDVLDERWGQELASFDTTYVEVFFAGDLPRRR